MVIKSFASTIAVILMINFTVLGQVKKDEIKIGDQIPDLVLNGIINVPGEKINLKDLHKNEVLIIDFWAKWCVPCVREMKFLDSLSNKHPGKFKVLMVARETKAEISTFLAKSTDIQLGKSKLYFAEKDSVLNTLFPHKTIPHNIWIDKTGTVSAITSGNEITERNILDFSETSRTENLRIKKDNFKFIPSDVFHLGDSIFTYRSIISPHISGISSGELSPSSGRMSRYFQWNQTILRAVWGAYSNFNRNMRVNLIEVNTLDSLKFFPPKEKTEKYRDNVEWEKYNTFCYALTLPKVVPDSVFASYIFDDMNRQFDLKVKIEDRITDCVVVRRKGATSKQITYSTSTKPLLAFTHDHKFIIKNAKMSDILEFLYRTFPSSSLPYPFVDKIENVPDEVFNLDLDFSLEPSLNNTGLTPEMIYNRFKNFGYQFSIEKHPYKKVVIYDIK